VDHPWQQIGGNGGDDPDAQPPRQRPRRSAGEVRKLVHRPQDVAPAGGKGLAYWRQTHLPRGAFDKGCPKDILQLLDLEREGGLRDGAGFRRTAEMGVLGEGIEVSQVLDRDRGHKPCLSR
jgi:hypothetical protein